MIFAISAQNLDLFQTRGRVVLRTYISTREIETMYMVFYIILCLNALNFSRHSNFTYWKFMQLPVFIRYKLLANYFWQLAAITIGYLRWERYVLLYIPYFQVVIWCLWIPNQSTVVIISSPDYLNCLFTTSDSPIIIKYSKKIFKCYNYPKCFIYRISNCHSEVVPTCILFRSLEIITQIVCCWTDLSRISKQNPQSILFGRNQMVEFTKWPSFCGNRTFIRASEAFLALRALCTEARFVGIPVNY